MKTNKKMRVSYLFLLVLVASCDYIPNPFAEKKVEKKPVVEEVEVDLEHESPYLIATVDRLSVRQKPGVTAPFVTKVAEGDTLIFLEEQSDEWLPIKLREQYFYEPWLKIEIKKTGKPGWVYGGGVRFVSPYRQEAVHLSNPVSAQIFSVDTAWADNHPMDWKDAGFSNPIQFKTFLLHFKEWIKNDDVQKIASLLDYPVEPIYSKKQFEEAYPMVFGDSIKRLILNQRLDRIDRKAGTAEIAGGAISFSDKNGKFKISKLNAYAQKVKKMHEVKDYRDAFSSLAQTYFRPSKEANPPRIAVKLNKKALTGEFIKYIGNSRNATILNDFTYQFTGDDEKVFVVLSGGDVVQKLTFTEKPNGDIDLIFDDFKNYKAGQRFRYSKK